MNQPYERLWRGRAAGSRRIVGGHLYAAQDVAAADPAGTQGGARKLVAYSILFQ
jgi:hypothetical protein